MCSTYVRTPTAPTAALDPPVAARTRSCQLARHANGHLSDCESGPNQLSLIFRASSESVSSALGNTIVVRLVDPALPANVLPAYAADAVRALRSLPITFISVRERTPCTPETVQDTVLTSSRRERVRQ